jgi:hypothetical protein
MKKLLFTLAILLMLTGCHFSKTVIKAPPVEQTAYEFMWVDDFKAISPLILR